MSKLKLLFRGPVLTASGYGVHARQLLKAIVDSNEFEVAVDSIRWGETPFLTSDTEWIDKLIIHDDSFKADISVQVTIPNEFKRDARVVIGVTAGIEVDRVSPTWLMKCNQEVDVVVVPSKHSANAFSVAYQDDKGNTLRLEKPLMVIPEGVDTTVFNKREKQPVNILDGMPEKNLIFIGLGLDKPRGLDRKNVTKLIEWFCKKFAGREDVGLILKTAVVNSSILDYETTTKRISDIKTSSGCGKFPKVRLIHGRLTDYELSAIYNDPRVTAAISVTHGEGFGLPLIEAAACGLPVIATDWSGHLEFLERDGMKMFTPVECNLVEIPQECVWDGVMDRGTRWAETTEETFGKAVDQFLSDEAGKNFIAQKLAKIIRDEFSLETTGKGFSSFVKDCVNQAKNQNPQTRQELISVLKKQYPLGMNTVVYTMPMSAGDVFLSSVFCQMLKERHEGMKVVLATDDKYKEIGEGVWDEVIQWHPWMTDISALEEVFGEVYTPNLSIQMVHSNWVHRGKGRNILEEMAVHCRFDPKDLEHDLPYMNTKPSSFSNEISLNDKWVAVHTSPGKDQWGARKYNYWNDVVENLKNIGYKIVQVGGIDDEAVKSDLDLRGKTSYKELPSILLQCKLLVSIDSFPMHVAAAYGVPIVSIFGGSYANSTGPLRKGKNKLTLIETEDRKGCEKACYKNECFVDKQEPCINNIPAKYIFDMCCESLGEGVKEFKEILPRIAGYTHILNPKSHGYPFIESIKSMLGFCESVVVVDGGSNDGSIELINEKLNDSLDRIQIIQRNWDYTEPGMDGMQKAFGRAMCPADVDFLWQQDADEVVHEDDYQKIKNLAKKLPAGIKLFHLPIIELWGSPKNVRTDRHSWKWRLSRNDYRVTHGINIHARVMDPKTGIVYAKKGMSDGCEYIDVITGDFIQHAGFYSRELDQLRVSNPQEYGKIMNKIFGDLPSVFHYSWCDLEGKVKQFKDFWDKQWSVLHGETTPDPRFPDVKTDEDVKVKAKELLERGGEHGKAELFTLEKSNPEVMSEWLKERKL